MNLRGFKKGCLPVPDFAAEIDASPHRENNINMTTLQKIADIEAEMARTQKNKGTLPPNYLFL
jgi:hypothetical protein